MNTTAGPSLRGVKMNHSVKIIPPRFIVAHSATQCQTKSALQRVRCLTRVLGDHMPFKKCAPKGWENVLLNNDAVQAEAHCETCTQ